MCWPGAGLKAGVKPFLVNLRPIPCILRVGVILKGFGTKIRMGDRARAGLATARAVRVVTVLCLVLLALFTVAQVAHVHADQTAADHCPLCISMHSAAPVDAAAAAPVIVQVGVSAPPVETQILVRHRYSKLFIRPPPQGC